MAKQVSLFYPSRLISMKNSEKKNNYIKRTISIFETDPSTSGYDGRNHARLNNPSETLHSWCFETRSTEHNPRRQHVTQVTVTTVQRRMRQEEQTRIIIKSHRRETNNTPTWLRCVISINKKEGTRAFDLNVKSRMIRE